MASGALYAQQLPNVSVETAEGKIIQLSELTGRKPLIISFWSLTCKPCMLELNTINGLLDEWREQADFDVIAVSTDDVRMKSQAKAKASSLGWDFVCIYDANKTLARAMNVTMTPQSFIVDTEGKIVYSHTGYTPGTEQELIDKVIEITQKK